MIQSVIELDMCQYIMVYKIYLQHIIDVTNNNTTLKNHFKHISNGIVETPSSKTFRL